MEAGDGDDCVGVYHTRVQQKRGGVGGGCSSSLCLLSGPAGGLGFDWTLLRLLFFRVCWIEVLLCCLTWFFLLVLVCSTCSDRALLMKLCCGCLRVFGPSLPVYVRCAAVYLLPLHCGSVGRDVRCFLVFSRGSGRL